MMCARTKGLSLALAATWLSAACATPIEIPLFDGAPQADAADRTQPPDDKTADLQIGSLDLWQVVDAPPTRAPYDDSASWMDGDGDLSDGGQGDGGDASTPDALADAPSTDGEAQDGEAEDAEAQDDGVPHTGGDGEL